MTKFDCVSWNIRIAHQQLPQGRSRGQLLIGRIPEAAGHSGRWQEILDGRPAAARCGAFSVGEMCFACTFGSQKVPKSFGLGTDLGIVKLEVNDLGGNILPNWEGYIIMHKSSEVC